MSRLPQSCGICINYAGSCGCALFEERLHRLDSAREVNAVLEGDAIRRAEILSREYSDVHCSVFTCDSFKRLFADLASAGLVDWTIQAIADVASGDNEFRVILKAL